MKPLPCAVAILTLALAGTSFAQSRSTPPIPYVDDGACPFEGCVYREWTANATVTVRKMRTANSAFVFRIAKGETVTALTGVVITTAPGRFQFLKEIDLAALPDTIHVTPDDVLYLLTYQGEGFTKAWFKGKPYHDVDISEFLSCDETRLAQCNLKQMVQPKSDWWVQVKNRNGLIGWTNETRKFDGKDALAAAEVR